MTIILTRNNVSHMYVCLCKGVTDHDIKRVISEEGATSFRAVRDHLAVSTQCGKCAPLARAIVNEQLNQLAHAVDFYDAAQPA